MPDSLTCPKCGNLMETGFMLEAAKASYLPTLWIEGEPEPTYWTLTKIKGKRKMRVASYRCRACGFLESYATEEWTGKFP